MALVKDPGAGTKYTGVRVERERVVGFAKGAADPALRHFFGYYVIEKRAVARMPAAGQAFGVMETVWEPLAREGGLGAWEYHGKYFDLGSVEDLRAAEEALAAATGDS